MRYFFAVIASHVEAWYWKITYFFMPHPHLYHGHERRVSPRVCVLCHGPMRPDPRPPRVVRGTDGKIRNVPGDVLAWFSCGRCYLSQSGVQR